ncbi:MAG TPA: DUF2652 domain-containing protein [Saprospiraceae bacterium]|nr:DUF2652 domain-containing protein [Saprospiraceae bacterium]
MSNQKQNLNPAGPALLFIPDISGFTDFVTNTEVSHSRHIIEELLEILVDTNEIGLEVNEIEGDAILFYRFGTAPTAAELLHQVQKMFIRFHTHLKKYHTHRICNCGACRTAHDLTLKFVAHYGDISVNTIKQYQKLFGSDVIVAHRLLKNDIPHHEYALFTQNLVRACPKWVDIDTTSWAPVQHSQQTYDSGPVSYCFLSMSPLLDIIPDPATEDFSIAGVRKHVLHKECTIEAPIDMVFNVVSDLPWRSKWIPGTLEKVVDMNSQLTQSGQTHRCMAKGPVLVAHDFRTESNTITFTETDAKKTHCTVYTLKKISEDSTHIQADVFLKKNPIMQLMFKLMMKKQFSAVMGEAFVNLNNYCKSLAAQGKEHPYWVVLEERQVVAA